MGNFLKKHIFEHLIVKVKSKIINRFQKERIFLENV